MQGRLCYVTIAELLYVTACCPSLNDYLPLMNRRLMDYSLVIDAHTITYHMFVHACLFVISWCHSLNSMNTQLEAKSISKVPPTAISHAQLWLTETVLMEWYDLFATEGGMFLTWRR